MAKEPIQIKLGQHIFNTGMTGSGKSELARFLIGNGGFCDVIVQDPKHEFEAPNGWGQENRDYAITADMYAIDKLFKRYHKVIWRPHVKELEEKSNWHRLDELYDFIYQTGGILFYDDEAGMSSTAYDYPLGKKRLLKQGRSKEITCFNTTQAPVGVPNDFMREATHAFIFYLNAETDRKKVAGNYGNRVLRMNEEQEAFDEFMFYYYSTKLRGQLVKCNPIPL